MPAVAIKRRWTTCAAPQYNLRMGAPWKAAHASAIATRIASVTVTLLLSLTLSATAFAHSRKHVPQPALFTTVGSLRAQNQEADRLRLPRIRTKSELHEIVQSGELVPIRTSEALKLKKLTGDHACLRPWAAEQAESLAEDFFLQARRSLTLTSAVRTVQEQKALRRWNPNAAPTTGEQASVHTTGIAFDISRTGLSKAQQRWLELHLWYLQQIGRVIVEEEQRQPCFHVVVIQQ